MVELCPPNYNFLNAPRSTGRGGGIVVLRAIAALFAGSFLVLNHNLLNLSMKYQCVASFFKCMVISTFSLIIHLIHLSLTFLNLT